jgi:hypothetical protein
MVPGSIVKVTASPSTAFATLRVVVPGPGVPGRVVDGLAERAGPASPDAVTSACSGASADPPGTVRGLTPAGGALVVAPGTQPAVPGPA